MASVLNSVPTAGISGETVVYTAATTPNPVTATFIGITICNNADAGAQKVNVRLKRGASFYNMAKNIPLPLGDTFVASGDEWKLIAKAGDEIRVSVDQGTVDVICTMLEQS